MYKRVRVRRNQTLTHPKKSRAVCLKYYKNAHISLFSPITASHSLFHASCHNGSSRRLLKRLFLFCCFLSSSSSSSSFFGQGQTSDYYCKYIIYRYVFTVHIYLCICCVRYSTSSQCWWCLYIYVLRNGIFVSFHFYFFLSLSHQLFFYISSCIYATYTLYSMAKERHRDNRPIANTNGLPVSSAHKGQGSYA